MNIKKIKHFDTYFGKDFFFYQVAYEASEIVSKFLTAISPEINIFSNLIAELVKSQDKLLFIQQSHQNDIFEDYPYPDNNILVWSNMDTTKNNLGKIVILKGFSQYVPYLVYSFTRNSFIVVEDVHPAQLESDYIPKIQEFEIQEFMNLLKEMKNLIDNYEDV